MKISLSSALRTKHNIGDDLLGLVTGTSFRHAECYSSIETLTAALDDEDNNIPVLKSDDWRHQVGPCIECGQFPDDGR